MKSSVILLLSILIVLHCTAQQEQQLQGLWNSSRIEYVPTHLSTDAAFNQIFHNTDLYFEGDSMWHLEFPCKRISVNTYSLEDFRFVNDSTFDYQSERYSRQKYDSGSIETLKIHELNPECYRGRWNLVRSESGGDGTGIVFIYPFKIKDSQILKDDALNGSVLKLLIAGDKKEFNFRMEKKDFEYELILTPTESWKKEDQVMWTRYWELPPPRRRELKEIKRTEGIALELRFRRI